jgi:hypothetical protein
MQLTKPMLVSKTPHIKPTVSSALSLCCNCFLVKETYLVYCSLYPDPVELIIQYPITHVNPEVSNT